MENFKKHMNIVDKVLNALFIAFLVVSIIMVCFGVLGFFVDTSYLGEVDTYITLGVLKIEIAEELLNSEDIDMYLIASSFLLAARFAVACVLMKLIKNIIEPMKEGKPFGNTASESLKKLAVFILCGGIVIDIIDFVGTILTCMVYHVDMLFNLETVSSYSISYTSTSDYIIIAAVLYLLSYVFKYGTQLQTQVDETL